jgi:hypothetical protein
MSKLNPYVDEFIVDHQCGYRSNRPTTDQICCIRKILQKNENVALHQQFIEFKTGCDSVRREGSYYIFVQLNMPIIIGQLIGVQTKSLITLG